MNAVRELYAVLCGERRPDALALLDAALLEIPEFTAPPPRAADERNQRTYQRLAALVRNQGGALGLAADRERLLAALDWAAVVDPALFHTAMVHCIICVPTILELGHPSPYLDKLTGELDRTDAVGLILITERGRGGSHLDPGTVAVFHPTSRSFTLHTPDPGAAKIMAHAAAPGVPKTAIVYAQLVADGKRRGVFPFALRLRTGAGPAEDVRIHTTPEVPALPLDYAEVTFDGTVVPYDGWLRDTASLTEHGHFTDPLQDPTLRLVRSTVFSAGSSTGAAVGCAAAARAAVTAALRYAEQRTTSGKLAPGLPVLGYRTQQEALYGALAEAWATNLLVARTVSEHPHPAAARQTQGRPPTWAPWTSVHRELSLAKAAAADALARITAVCRTRSGAQGTISVNRVTDYEGLAHVFQAAAGDNLLIRLDIGKSLTEDTEFAPEPLAAPPYPDLTNPETAQYLAATRETGLLNELRTALATATPGTAPFEVWNPLLSDALRLTDAHLRVLTLQAFDDATRATSGEARQATDALRTLYALNGIEEDLSWHLRHGTLTAKETAALPTARTHALADVHAQRTLLTRALAIPPTRLQSPMTEPPATP